MELVRHAAHARLDRRIDLIGAEGLAQPVDEGRALGHLVAQVALGLGLAHRGVRQKPKVSGSVCYKFRQRTPESRASIEGVRVSIRNVCVFMCRRVRARVCARA